MSTIPVVTIESINHEEYNDNNGGDLKHHNDNKCQLGVSKLWLFGRKNMVEDSSPDRIQNVPGSLGTTFFNIIKLVYSGHNFYRNKRDENNSNIYRLQIYDPRIVLCSYESISYLYTSSHVKKEPMFGMFTYNPKVLDNHIPLIFENNDLHHQRRKIFIEFAKLTFCNKTFIKDTFETVERELIQVSKISKLSNNFEDNVAKCVCDVLMTVTLGIKLDHTLVKIWMENCLIKKFKKGKEEVIAVYNKFEEVIKACPKFDCLMKNITSLEISTSVVCNELIFSFIFNAYAALRSLVVSMMIYMDELSVEDFNLLKTEATRFHKSEFQNTDFDELTNIKHFTLEVLRLFPPANFLFRRVQEDFVMSIKSGKFQIRKNDILCGNVYLCQRDPDIFENPDEFDFHRFERNPELVDYLMCFGAPFTQENEEQVHKCAGQRLAMTLLQTFASQLLFVQTKFASKPIWTGNNVKRFIGSDKPVKVKLFEFDGIKTS